MRITEALDDALATRAQVRVLRALHALPEGLAVSVRDVARRAGIGHPRASEILAALSVQGITEVQRVGRADLYQLNREHVLFAPLERLFEAEGQVGSQLEAFLRRQLPKAIPELREAYLFGSVARGESRAASDIDLALVMPSRKRGDLDAALEDIEQKVRTRFGSVLSVHTTAQGLSEGAKRRKGHGLWGRVAREGIKIIPAR